MENHWSKGNNNNNNILCKYVYRICPNLIPGKYQGIVKPGKFISIKKCHISIKYNKIEN